MEDTRNHYNEFVKDYLQTYKDPYNLVFTQKDYLKIKKIFSCENTKSLPLDLAIRQELKSFIHNLGKVRVNFFKSQINIDYFPNTTLINTIRSLTEISQTIDYVDPYIINFNKEHMNILSNVLEYDSNSVAFRETIREAIPYVFELNLHSVFFGTDKFIVRIINTKREENEMFLNHSLYKIELEVDDLNNTYNIMTNFESIIKPHIIKHIKLFKISNNEFFKIKIKQTINILYIITNKNKNNFYDTVFTYIIRENFITLHEIFSTILLDNIIINKGTSVNFLEFYTKETILTKEGTFQIQVVKDTNNNKWSLPNIKNICIQHNNIINEKQEINKSIEEQKYSLELLINDVNNEKAKLNTYNSKFSENEENFKSYDIKLALLKNEEQKEKNNKTRLNEIKQELKKLYSTENDLLKTRKGLKALISNQLMILAQIKDKRIASDLRIQTTEDKLKRITRSSKEIENKYQLMKDALTLSLSKPPVKIK